MTWANNIIVERLRLRHVGKMKFLKIFRKDKGADMPADSETEIIEQMKTVFHEKDII